MTDTTLSYKKVGGCYEILPNHVLFQLAHQNFHEMEMSPYTEEEKNLAKVLSMSLPEEQLKKDREVLDMDSEGGFIHKETLSQEAAKNYPISGSSDIGDVSWLMPFSAIFTAAWPLGVNAHTWQSASASGSYLGQKGMLYASKIMDGRRR